MLIRSLVDILMDILVVYIDERLIIIIMLGNMLD
jgi:hypothetical protein